MPYQNAETQRQYQREWVARRRASWFADKKCWRCGAADDLQLDHRDPNTKVANAIWSWSKARREAELAKCQVLCSPCHLWKTVGCEERAHGSAHGAAKLSEDQVREVRRLRAGGMTYAAIGIRYGIGRNTAWRAVNGQNWTHVDDTPA